MKSLHGIWLGALSLSLVGCSNTTGPEANARVEVLLTDAPADYLKEARVCISQVYLQGGEGEEGEEGEHSGRTILWDADPEDPEDRGAQCFDLLTLQGVEASLMEGGVEVPAGTYAQLRLVVDHASVVLKEPYTFRDGLDGMELSVPSGAQTGIKVLLSTPVVLEPETLTQITVDAPVGENFRIQGDPESPSGIQGVLFTPVLKEVENPE